LKIVYRIFLKTTTVDADLQVMEDGETVRISAPIDLQRRTILNRVIGTPTGGWKAADHVFLTIPSLGRKHTIQAHPFTIASTAPIPDDFDATLELIIRAQDGFSLDLLHAAAERSSLSVRIDGPYGSGHARNLLVDSDLAIVVAGGSGIAVAWPLVNYLLDRRRTTDTRVATEAELKRQHIVLIWVVHRMAHLSWIPQSDLQLIDDRGAQVIIPQATEEAGRPDLAGIIDGVVVQQRHRKRIGVVGSGPDSMGRAVRNTCAKLVRDGRGVNVTIEKFGW
jgi:NAD(P)H-flavin reductase